MDLLLSEHQKRALLDILGFDEGSDITDAWFVSEINGVKISVSGKRQPDMTEREG